MKSQTLLSLFLAVVCIPQAVAQNGEIPPVAVRQIDPEYGPELSKSFIIEPVRVDIVIDNRGDPVALSTPASIPDNVVQALSQCQYKPGKKDGVAVPFTISLVVQVRRPLDANSERGLRRRWTPDTRGLANALKDGTGFSPADVLRLEENLRSDLADVETRASLLVYAIEAGAREPQDRIALRERLIATLVESVPDAGIFDSPLVSINTTAGPLQDAAGYQHIRELWMKRLAGAPQDPAILRHATHFLRISDPENSEQALLPAVRTVDGAAVWLGDLYGLALLGVTGLDLTKGLPAAAGDRLPETPFTKAATSTLLSTTDARIILSALSSFTAGGRALAQLKRLPDGYASLCDQLLAHARELYPNTSATCDPSAVVADDRPAIQRIRVGGNVQAAQLIRKVTPRYPDEAKSRRIQGVVRFTTIIGKDGNIRNLELVSAPLALYKAAREAVSQWQYRPTKLNGNPVEVVTRIDVNYTLSDR